jgi:hypothetical protein
MNGTFPHVVAGFRDRPKIGTVSGRTRIRAAVAGRGGDPVPDPVRVLRDGVKGTVPERGSDQGTCRFGRARPSQDRDGVESDLETGLEAEGARQR